MRCPKCNTDLPDPASFCWNCGYALAADAQANQTDWEHCEIECALVDDPAEFSSYLSSTQWFQGIRLQFQAVIDSSRDKQVISQSPVFKAAAVFPPEEDDAQAKRAYHEFVESLLDQGWEPIPERGQEWYSRRFQRQTADRP